MSVDLSPEIGILVPPTSAIIVDLQRITANTRFQLPTNFIAARNMHPNRASSVARVLILTLLIPALVGCGQHSRYVSQLATAKGPIAIEANVDGSGDITTPLSGKEPSVTFHFGGNRQIIIDQNRILVDDEVYPAAPAGTKVIGINVQNGNVKLTADGNPITK